MTEYGQQGPFAPGARLLDQYEVVKLLGSGGHAFVYECRDLFLDEHLAVKVIPNPPNRGRELLNRARAEAQLLRRLSHPNVVRMHTAAALGDDMVCLVMEKLDGVTLRHLLALLQRLSVVEAAHIVRQMAVGVAAAHDLDVVHRDIKPDNAFVLPPNNHVKVLDFGIAKFLGRGLQTSNKYRFQGTPIYMSPEHLRGAGVTVRSDVYQLGTVLFELLTGINPNLVDLQNPGFEQIAFVQITRQTPALTRLLPDAPADLEALIQRATAKDPAARFASMSEFIEALDRIMVDHCSRYPAEPSGIRYVNAALMQSAKELAAREEAFAWGPRTESNPNRLHSIDATMPLSAPIAPISSPAPKSPDTNSPDGPTDKMVSFHPVPLLSGRDESSLPNRRQSQPPLERRDAKQKRSSSLVFVATGLGVGVLIGVAFLWWMGRTRVDVVPASPSVSVSTQPAREVPSAVGTGMATANARTTPPLPAPFAGPVDKRKAIATSAGAPKDIPIESAPAAATTAAPLASNPPAADATADVAPSSDVAPENAVESKDPRKLTGDLTPQDEQ